MKINVQHILSALYVFVLISIIQKNRFELFHIKIENNMQFAKLVLISYGLIYQIIGVLI